MTTMNKSILSLIANTIRGLSIDAIEAANSGHPGLPLGCAELAAYLYGVGLQHNPQNPSWQNRDRFVLSAGHGSMLLYASLHLAGFDVTLENLKQFRQLNSPTAGHPEYGHLAGIECTTGPLGQGVAMAAGMSLAQAISAAQHDAAHLLTSKTVVLAGDGCMMEGIASEAASLSGHLGLANLILIYDANDICLDGTTDECFTEDTSKRFEAYGWQVLKIDGHDFDQIHQAYEKAKSETAKPTLIIAKTIIGKGSPNRAGSSEAHGKALGKEEALLTKNALGLPGDQAFYVPQEVRAYFNGRLKEQGALEQEWNQAYSAWSTKHPEASAAWSSPLTVPLLNSALTELDAGGNKATRQSSNVVLQKLHDVMPTLLGGSADLSCSDSTLMKKGGFVKRGDFNGRNIKYGVREFAMASMANGIALYGHHVPFVGTFLTFSDYMKNAIRLAAIMNLKVIYQFTHDSIFLGEDGPTHQPVEHLAGLRAMPQLTVIRPANGKEVKGAWETALTIEGPVALILSRQGVSDEIPTDQAKVSQGAYIVSDNSKGARVDFCILATGTELTVAAESAKRLAEEGHTVRLVSFPSFERFEDQTDEYKNEVLGNNVKVYASIEAQSSFGWHKYVGRDGICFSVDTFGKSGTGEDLAIDFGFTADSIVSRLVQTLQAVR